MGDGAAAVLAQVGRGGLGAGEDAGEVGVDDRAPLGRRHPGQRLDRLDGRVVDEGREAAAGPVGHLADQPVACLLVRQVRPQDDRLAAQLPDAGGDFTGRLHRRTAVEGHRRALLGEAQGDGGADAAARAGHQGGLSVEEGHGRHSSAIRAASAG